MPKICKKCGYERQDSDKAPDYECPQCGAIYAKVEAKMKQDAEAKQLEIDQRALEDQKQQQQQLKK